MFLTDDGGELKVMEQYEPAGGASFYSLRQKGAKAEIKKCTPLFFLNHIWLRGGSCITERVQAL